MDRVIVRAKTAALYLLYQDGPRCFTIRSDSKRFKILLKPFRCSHCGEKKCIHVLFVLLRVLKLDETHNLVTAPVATDHELDEVLDTFIQDRTRQRQERVDAARAGGDSDDTTASHHPHDDEDQDCPICLLPLVEGECVSACSECHHALHVHCLTVWADNQRQDRVPVSCPLCRAAWNNFHTTSLLPRARTPPSTIVGRSVQAGRAMATGEQTSDNTLASRACPAFARPWLAALGADTVSGLLSSDWRRRTRTLEQLAQSKERLDTLDTRVALDIVARTCRDPVLKVLRASLHLLSQTPRPTTAKADLHVALAHIVLRCHESRTFVLKWCHGAVSMGVANSHFTARDVTAALFHPPATASSVDTQSWQWMLGSVKLAHALTQDYPHWFAHVAAEDVDAFICARVAFKHARVNQVALQLQAWAEQAHRAHASHQSRWGDGDHAGEGAELVNDSCSPATMASASTTTTTTRHTNDDDDDGSADGGDGADAMARVDSGVVHHSPPSSLLPSSPSASSSAPLTPTTPTAAGGASTLLAPPSPQAPHAHAHAHAHADLSNASTTTTIKEPGVKHAVHPHAQRRQQQQPQQQQPQQQQQQYLRVGQGRVWFGGVGVGGGGARGSELVIPACECSGCTHARVDARDTAIRDDGGDTSNTDTEAELSSDTDADATSTVTSVSTTSNTSSTTTTTPATATTASRRPSSSPSSCAAVCCACELCVTNGGELWISDCVLGKGAVGTVHRARCIRTGAPFAVKQVDVGLAKVDDVKRLHTEVDIMRRLPRHAHVVSYFGCNQSAAAFAIAMELLPGGSLADKVAAEGALHAHDVRSYARDATKGLAFLHSRGIAHRDLKGANLLLTGRNRVKVCDFGLSATLADMSTQTNELQGSVGTPAWMAPEVIVGERVSRRSDCWSLGCCLIELWSGRKPWAEANLPNHYALMFMIASRSATPRVPPHITGAARDFAGRCLVRDVGQRWTSEQLLTHAFIAPDALVHGEEEVEEQRCDADGGADGGGENADVLNVMKSGDVATAATKDGGEGTNTEEEQVRGNVPEAITASQQMQKRAEVHVQGDAEEDGQEGERKEDQQQDGSSSTCTMTGDSEQQQQQEHDCSIAASSSSSSSSPLSSSSSSSSSLLRAADHQHQEHHHGNNNNSSSSGEQDDTCDAAAAADDDDDADDGSRVDSEDDTSTQQQHQQHQQHQQQQQRGDERQDEDVAARPVADVVVDDDDDENECYDDDDNGGSARTAADSMVCDGDVCSSTRLATRKQSTAAAAAAATTARQTRGARARRTKKSAVKRQTSTGDAAPSASSAMATLKKSAVRREKSVKAGSGPTPTRSRSQSRLQSRKPRPHDAETPTPASASHAAPLSTPPSLASSKTDIATSSNRNSSTRRGKKKGVVSSSLPVSPRKMAASTAATTASAVAATTTAPVSADSALAGSVRRPRTAEPTAPPPPATVTPTTTTTTATIATTIITSPSLSLSPQRTQRSPLRELSHARRARVPVAITSTASSPPSLAASMVVADPLSTSASSRQQPTTTDTTPTPMTTSTTTPTAAAVSSNTPPSSSSLLPLATTSACGRKMCKVRRSAPALKTRSAGVTASPTATTTTTRHSRIPTRTRTLV
ncbi:STE/STE11/MEKK2 protein kinase [Salpingoeca rosetta]|uniref:STE/STE11/MEKK2 protein kinase n=1 Tax=Salpingoeca rosetta (strain ATCC 50818 / BSB-021) TaxID=946362 RepID=F2UP85_SALR5|nr:STE/STE11/MEKK2 protein kinase [Salpingoeca rosetta]EGD79440.1 STE/STE11/MEKK2 protein kinase [Salpingoeca rosetta]|eukprot:XP_004988921.1 STE/STE11/MEKK2 protein kinase [Salpingoeca rosetta]